MRPPLCHTSIELSPAAHAIITRIRRAKVFVFLRQPRHTLLADPLQQELATLYKDHPQGQPFPARGVAARRHAEPPHLTQRPPVVSGNCRTHRTKTTDGLTHLPPCSAW
jgi:hypothetical protein